MNRRRGQTIQKALKFVIVGSAGVLVNYAVLITLYEMVGLPLLVASAIAVELSIAHNFVLNNWWTFSQTEVSLVRFVKFNAVSFVGLLITVGVIFVLVTYVGVHYLVANLLGIGLATVSNFGLNLIWTWGWSE